MKIMKNFFTTKLLIFTVLMSAFFAVSTAYAGDCFSDPIYDRDWNAEVTTGAFVRDVACMEGSVVMTTLSVGEVVHVIAETDGWYQIERSDGTTGWVGQWLIEATSKSFSPDVVAEPEPVNVPVPELYNEPMYDVEGHRYEDSILFIYDEGIVNGYEDGSYKPDQVLNRAELLKIVVEAVYVDEFKSFSSDKCFDDVPAGEWYTQYVCFAKDQGIVEGYGDGTFRPTDSINLVEALKIALEVYNYDYPESSPWYEGLYKTAADYDFIPPDFDDYSDYVHRGQMAELITRIIKYEL